MMFNVVVFSHCDLLFVNVGGFFLLLTIFAVEVELIFHAHLQVGTVLNVRLLGSHQSLMVCVGFDGLLIILVLAIHLLGS